MMAPQLIQAYVTFLGGLLTGVLIAWLTHRLTRTRDAEQQRWQENQETGRRQWEAMQSEQKQRWEEKQSQRDEDVRRRLQAQSEAWQEQAEKQRREWEEAKKLLHELRDALSLRTTTGKTAVSEIEMWNQLPQMLGRTRKFAALADFDATSLCNLLMREPVEIQLPTFTHNLETQLSRTLTEGEARLVLTKMGLTPSGPKWVLTTYPAYDFDTILGDLEL